MKKTVLHERLDKGQKWADKVTCTIGSWKFISFIVVFIIIWVTLNSFAWVYKWDSHPFIVLNLCLSTLAAMQAPIILMSQKRAAERERAKLEQDYLITKKSELEIEHMQLELDEIKAILKKKAK
ncbi:MAG: DUF1003 domain-containing protein [Candidatus Micrarchaeota archaeon]